MIVRIYSTKNTNEIKWAHNLLFSGYVHSL